MGDRGDLEDLLHLARAEIAARFAERRLGLERVGADAPFEHDLGVRGHERIECFGLHDLDRFAVERARETVFVDAVGHFACRGEQQARAVRR